MIDMSDPRLQQRLQKRMTKEYWGGVAGFAPEIAAYNQEEAKRGVQMGDVYLHKQMQNAQIEQMTHDQKMAEERLGLATGYLGLRGQEQTQLQSQETWKNDWYNKTLDQKKKELDLTTLTGLPMAAWAGYEGGRRYKLLEEDAADTKEFKRRLREKGLLV
jgi:hypothetical protein